MLSLKSRARIVERRRRGAWSHGQRTECRGSKMPWRSNVSVSTHAVASSRAASSGADLAGHRGLLGPELDVAAIERARGPQAGLARAELRHLVDEEAPAHEPLAERRRRFLHHADQVRVAVSLSREFEEAEQPVVIEEEADAPVAAVEAVPKVRLGQPKLLVHHIALPQLFEEREHVPEIRDDGNAAVRRPIRVDRDHEQPIVAAIRRAESLDYVLHPARAVGVERKTLSGTRGEGHQ